MTTTQRSPRASRSRTCQRPVCARRFAGRRPRRLPARSAAAAPSASAACSPTTEVEDNQLAASPANIASLTAVVQRNPNDPQAYNMRGSVFGQAGRNDEALADFNKAISLDPNYAQAYANRGLIHRKTGKLDLALADYNKALDARPELRGRLSRPRHRPPAAASRRSTRSTISTRRSRSVPTTPRPITTAACSIRASGSTSTRSTISRPRSG